MNQISQVSRAAPDKLPFLDGIRGFAAFWVLACHCLIECGWSLPLISKGELAVEVFMIMSGFLMTYHYYKRKDLEPWESRRTWLMFYTRRFFRIAPLYYVLLFIAFIIIGYLSNCMQEIVAAFPHGVSALDRYRDNSISNIIMHVTFLFGLVREYVISTPLPDWSIGLEMQFYAVFPFLMLSFKYLSFLPVTVVIYGTSAIANKLFVPGLLGGWPMPSLLPLKINFFAIGILLAAAHYYKFKDPKLKTWLIILAIAVSAYTKETLQMSLFIFAFSVFVAAILFYDREREFLRINQFIQLSENLLSNKTTSFMADASYAVYLLHPLILIPVAAMFAKIPAYVALSGAARFGILFLIVTLIVYSAAPILYKYIEEPGIKLGKNILKTKV